MSRDHRKLRVYAAADELAIRIYAETRAFPMEERFHPCAQLRRAAVSVVCNIVEGSARRSGREHVHFLNIAAGSLAETRYLVDLSARLGLLSQGAAAALEQSAAAVASQLETMIRRLLGRESREKR